MVQAVGLVVSIGAIVNDFFGKEGSHFCMTSLYSQLLTGLYLLTRSRHSNI